MKHMPYLYVIKLKEMKNIAKGIKTVRIETANQVFNDYGKLVNEVKIFVVTKLEENKAMNGFNFSFKTYSETFGNGGFETTLCIKNASVSKLEMFLTTPAKAKNIASQIGAELTSFTTNNKVK